MPEVNAFIGLGSNLDNPLQQVRQALIEMDECAGITVIDQSPLYRSHAIGPGIQPDYVNGVVQIKTLLAPDELLDALQAIEQNHRRVRNEHWGPRTLDLDILLIESSVITTERLNVPHPYLTQRNFVLYPLADIAPELILPDGTTLADLLVACPRDGLALIE